MWLFDKGGIIKDKDREKNGWEAKEFFMKFIHADCDRICVENPAPLHYWKLPKCSQIIEPYYFGDPWKKRTMLWLKGLPCLTATNIVEVQGLWVQQGHSDRSNNRCKIYPRKGVRSAKQRSKTFPGIAKAMAEQWG